MTYTITNTYLIIYHYVILARTGDKRAHSAHLSEHDEMQLVNYITYMAATAQPVSIEWVLLMAARLASHRYTFCELVIIHESS